MLTISKVFTILCLLCLYGNREYLGSFQTKSVSSPFKWVPKYILFLAKVKGEEKSCIDWVGKSGQAQIYPLNYLLYKCGGSVNFCESVHRPIPILPVGIWNTQAVFKINQ